MHRRCTHKKIQTLSAVTQLMTLAINLVTAPVQASVQIVLLGFRNVTAIFGLIPVQAVLFTSKFGIIVGCLPGINLTVRNTPINTGLLIVDALLNLIDTRMARIWHARNALSVDGSSCPDQHSQREAR
jgi:hypothetical protein